MKRLAFLIPVLIGTLALTTSPVTPRSPGWLCDCDHLYYWQMTQGYQSRAPFGSRVLKPLLTRVLPIPHDLGTVAITIWSLALLACLIYIVLRRLRFDATYALSGVIFTFSLSSLTRANMVDVYLVDALALALLALAVYAAISHRFNLFTISLVLGVLAKEAVFVAVPIWYIYNRNWKTTALVSLPAFGSFLVLRLIVPPGTSYIELLSIIPQYRQTHPAALWEFLPFGLLPIFMLIHADGRKLLIRFLPLFLLVCAQLFIASDTARLLVYAFIPVLVAALYGLRATIRCLKLPKWTVCALAGLEFALSII